MFLKEHIHSCSGAAKSLTGRVELIMCSSFSFTASSPFSNLLAFGMSLTLWITGGRRLKWLLVYF